ncbi:unnamed protein product [Closterium sp. Naga37s-1]|nr:unnamed protein product [Closterium sp. Naga37s-1]
MEGPYRVRKRFDSGHMWDVGAVLLGGFVPGVVVTKCVAVVGALASSSWCAAIVIVAAGLHHIHVASHRAPVQDSAD